MVIIWCKRVKRRNNGASEDHDRVSPGAICGGGWDEDERGKDWSASERPPATRVQGMERWEKEEKKRKEEKRRKKRKEK